MTIRSIIKKMAGKMPFKAKTYLLNILQASFSDEERITLGQNNTFLCLRRLMRHGYAPSCIIDVGAHEGSWTREVLKIFSNSKFIAVEALPDKKIILENAFKNKPVKVYNNLLGDSNRSGVRFYSMETGSSVLNELTSISRSEIQLEMITLDEIFQRENIQGNILLKLDVQGFELEVLKGSKSILNQVDVICMELSFLNYNEGAPLAHDVISQMHELGFYILDITNFHRKSNDFVLVQSDFVFIKSNNPIRRQFNDLKKDLKMMETSH